MAGLLPPVVATILADSTQYSASMDKNIAKMEAFGATGDTVGAKVGAMWGKLATATLATGVGVAAVSVDLAFKYQDALDLMQRSTNLTASQMTYLKAQILNVSTATATSAETIVSGEQQLIKSGESVKQSLTDVAQAAKYAKATGADLNTTLTAAIGIQRLHIAGTRSMTQTLNIFDTAVKNSQLTSDNLTSALSGRALSAFGAYGIDIKSAVTLLAGFADQNLVGTKATMALKTGIAALEKPAETAKGKLTTQALAVEKVGLNMTTLASEIRKPGGTLQVMQQLSMAFDHNASSAMKAQGMAAWLQQIFGTSAGPAFTNLITELPKLQTLYDKMSTSGGAVNSSFAQWLKSPAGAFEQFKTVLENSAIKLGDVLLPKLTVGLIDATKIITGVLGSPTKSNIAEDAVITLLGAAVATKVIAGIGSVIGGLGVGASFGGGAEVAAIAPAVGAVTAAGIASFLGTLTLLKHNFLGLGTAVDALSAKILGATENGTTDYAGTLKALLNKQGITNNATISLSPATIAYLEGRPNPNKASLATRNTQQTVKTKTGVKVVVVH